VANKTTITPWEVKGKIDYNHVTEQFGTTPLDSDILLRMKSHYGRLHFMLKRGVFYSHRDLDRILDHYECGGRFVLYTGRGPSGPVHLGHLVPWTFTKYLQDTYGCKLIFQFTDDEKLILNEDFDSTITDHWVYENALDLMALGFDPDNTEFIVNMRHTSKLFPIALKIAKRITGSTMRAVFGFNDKSNLGSMFFPSMQAAPCFLESERTGDPVPCLIPAGIDQDPYWRITRDLARKLGYPKPAQIHGRMLPGLTSNGKMSSSRPETAIYTTDIPELVEWKINSVEPPEERADCPLFLLHFFLLTESDEDLLDIQQKCKTCRSCDACKMDTTRLVNRFLKKHQQRRELMGKSVNQMLE
jgi:tryptophanyl-tRNA synthetase